MSPLPSGGASITKNVSNGLDLNRRIKIRNDSSDIVTLKPSFQLKTGERPKSDTDPGGEYDGTFVEDYEYVEDLGHLDECNGRTGVTPEFGETYYYVITDTWPYLPRCVVNQPNRTWF